MFQFQGPLSASKSLLNRALIIQSYFPGLKIHGFSKAKDVVALQTALADLHKTEFHAEEGGTTFRFLVLRLSRLPGRKVIFANPQLLKRPQHSLIEILNQLGVQCDVFQDRWVIQSLGWQNPKEALKVQSSESSQFLSSVLLNAWNLPFDLKIQVEGQLQSESYFLMTQKMVEDSGMRIQKGSALSQLSEDSHTFVITQNQKVNTKDIRCEPDLSSAFSLAACGLVNGNVVIEPFPENSSQADFYFLKIFEKMGIHFHHEKGQFKIRKQKIEKSVQVDLGDCPDLFPVLAAICALAPGKSVLYGAPQLKHKESDRIAGVADLLKKVKCPFQERPDGIEIHGAVQIDPELKIHYDPRNDHRLAMAAQVFNLAGFKIDILNKNCVQKSFPEFWQIVGAG